MNCCSGGAGFSGAALTGAAPFACSVGGSGAVGASGSADVAVSSVGGSVATSRPAASTLDPELVTSVGGSDGALASADAAGAASPLGEGEGAAGSFSSAVFA